MNRDGGAGPDRDSGERTGLPGFAAEASTARADGSTEWISDPAMSRSRQLADSLASQSRGFEGVEPPVSDRGSVSKASDRMAPDNPSQNLADLLGSQSRAFRDGTTARPEESGVVASDQVAASEVDRSRAASSDPPTIGNADAGSHEVDQGLADPEHGAEGPRLSEGTRDELAHGTRNGRGERGEYDAVGGNDRILVHDCGGMLEGELAAAIERAYGGDVADGVHYMAGRMHDGTTGSLDHEIPGIGHDLGALAEYLDSWRGNLNYLDNATGASVAYDMTRGTLIVRNSYMIHAYQYNYSTFVSTERYTLKGHED